MPGSEPPRAATRRERVFVFGFVLAFIAVPPMVTAVLPFSFLPTFLITFAASGAVWLVAALVATKLAKDVDATAPGRMPGTGHYLDPPRPDLGCQDIRDHGPHPQPWRTEFPYIVFTSSGTPQPHTTVVEGVQWCPGVQPR